MTFMRRQCMAKILDTLLAAGNIHKTPDKQEQTCERHWWRVCVSKQTNHTHHVPHPSANEPSKSLENNKRGLPLVGDKLGRGSDGPCEDKQGATAKANLDWRRNAGRHWRHETVDNAARDGGQAGT
jgi:hypothetical protein